MEINEEKRIKFMEYAGKRVNNVLHDIQILEPMARSNSYDFTKEDGASSSSTEALAMRSSLFLETDGAAGFGAGAGADARLLRNGVSPRFRASSGELASWLPR